MAIEISASLFYIYFSRYDEKSSFACMPKTTDWTKPVIVHFTGLGGGSAKGFEDLKSAFPSIAETALDAGYARKTVIFSRADAAKLVMMMTKIYD